MKKLETIRVFRSLMGINNSPDFVNKEDFE